MFVGNLVATSNRIKWTQTATLINRDTNTAINLAGATITIGIRAPGQSHCRLTGTTSNGKVVITDGANGVFTWSFPATDMKTLEAGEYEVGVVAVTASLDEYQILAVQLPVIDGVVDP